MCNIEILQGYYQNNTRFADEWRASGKKVVGYFCNTVPEEMIIAAGFLPVRITGRPGRKNTDALIQLGPAEGYVQSMLSNILNGDYACLDYIIVPHSRGSVHKMYSILNRLRACDYAGKIPELYFLDHTHTAFMTSQMFNRDRMMELKSKLEEWAGREITVEDLNSAIALCNDSRHLLKELENMRVSGKVSGTKAMEIIGATMFIEKAEGNALLKGALSEIEREEGSGKVRLFLSGGPQDYTGLYELIEDCGAVVVAEDHCWGNRWSDGYVVESADPMDAIIRRYNTISPCAHTFPLKGRVDYCVQAVQTAKVQGAIFYCLKNDPQAWDIPDELKALSEKKIPTLYLAKQKYGDYESLRDAIKGFIAECGQADSQSEAESKGGKGV